MPAVVPDNRGHQGAEDAGGQDSEDSLSDGGDADFVPLPKKNQEA